FLKTRLRPVPAPDADRVARLIKDLDSERFDVREQATRELEKIGTPATPLLRKAREGDPTPEARRRPNRLLASDDEMSSVPERRAIEVRERIAPPEAGKLLQTLPTGAPDARLTREAKVALQRLGTR